MSRTCPNCGIPSEGRYCAGCGQDNRRDRLETRAVLGDTLQNLVGWDSALARTLRSLVTNPGQLAAEYVSGRRRRFVNPARFCLLSLALWFFVAQAVGLDPIESSGFKVTPSGEDSQALHVAEVMREFLATNLNVLLYLSLPLLAILLRAAFRKSGRNLAECLVLVLYLGGLRYLLTTLSIPLQFSFNEVTTVVRIVLVLGWSIHAARAFFDVGIVEAAIKTSLCTFGHLVATIFFFLGVALAWVIVAA